MTNKPMLSVEREFLESLAEYVADSPNAVIRARSVQLRALLDAPAYPNRLCHIDYTAHPYICGCLKGDEEAQRRFDEHQAKATQHRGEPVAIPRTSGIGRDADHPKALVLYLAKVPDDNDIRAIQNALRQPAEQPAPVVTVAKLTQAVHDVAGFPGVTGYQLRELADRLNGGKP